MNYKPKDPDLMELLEIYSNFINQQGRLIDQLVEKIKRLEEDKAQLMQVCGAIDLNNDDQEDS